jgi:hypothetical protein
MITLHLIYINEYIIIILIQNVNELNIDDDSIGSADSDEDFGYI